MNMRGAITFLAGMLYASSWWVVITLDWHDSIPQMVLTYLGWAVISFISALCTLLIYFWLYEYWMER